MKGLFILTTLCSLMLIRVSFHLATNGNTVDAIMALLAGMVLS